MQRFVDDILVSVIVPIYNVEAFLPQCIDSLLTQTHPNLEIILVDDGSPDSSGNICDDYAAHHSHIRVIHKENGGLSSARNAGISAAAGEYIGFVDSDDFVKETMFRSLLEAAVSTESAIAACGRFTTDEAGNVKGQAYTLPRQKVYSAEAAMEQVLTLGELNVAAWDKLYRKELFQSIRFPVGRINEDAAIMFQLMEKSTQVVHIGEPMYYYRERGGSITKSGYKPNKIHALEHAEQIEQLLVEKHPRLKPFCRRYMAYTCCQLLSLMLKDPQAKKQYPDHYTRYMKGLRKNMWKLYDNPNISLPWKLRGTVVYLNLYEALYRILK